MSTTINLVLICGATLVFLCTRIGLTWSSLMVVVLLFLVPAMLGAYASYAQYRIYDLELGLTYLAVKGPGSVLRETTLGRAPVRARDHRRA